MQWGRIAWPSDQHVTIPYTIPYRVLQWMSKKYKRNPLRESGSTRWILFQPPAADRRHYSQPPSPFFSAVLSFSLTSPLSSLPSGFLLYFKSGWRWGHSLGYFSSWHFTLISPPTPSLPCPNSIIPVISSLTEYFLKRWEILEIFSHHRLTEGLRGFISVSEITTAIDLLLLFRQESGLLMSCISSHIQP